MDATAPIPLQGHRELPGPLRSSSATTPAWRADQQITLDQDGTVRAHGRSRALGATDAALLRKMLAFPHRPVSDTDLALAVPREPHEPPVRVRHVHYHASALRVVLRGLGIDDAVIRDDDGYRLF